MGYLVLTRRPGDSIHLSIAPDADPSALIEKLRNGGGYIDVHEFRGNQVRIGIQAPDELNIVRDELLDQESVLQSASGS